MSIKIEFLECLTKKKKKKKNNESKPHKITI